MEQETIKNGGDEKTAKQARSYWIFYRYGYGGFLFWNWTHASC